MSKSISINALSLATEILNNKDKAGSTDWDIYVDMDGNIDCRHNTFDNSEWFEIVDLYSCWDDEDTLSMPADEYAEWLRSDAIPYFEDIELWNDDSMEFESVSVDYK